MIFFTFSSVLWAGSWGAGELLLEPPGLLELLELPGVPAPDEEPAAGVAPEEAVPSDATGELADPDPPLVEDPPLVSLACMSFVASSCAFLRLASAASSSFFFFSMESLIA